VEGFPLSYLEGIARLLAARGNWETFMDALATMLYGIVLFSRCEEFIEFAAIDAFLAFKHRGESFVVSILADVLHTLNVCHAKKGEKVLCCVQVLYVWLVTTILKQADGSFCPFENFRNCFSKNDINWQSYLACLEESKIIWCSKWKNVSKMIWHYGNFPNVPLMGTRACISYNPILGMRQHGYPIRGAPLENAITPFLIPSLSLENGEMLAKVRRAWDKMIKKALTIKSKEDVEGSYKQWLQRRVHTIGLPIPEWGMNIEEDGELPQNLEEVLRLEATLEKMKNEKEKLRETLEETKVEKERLQETLDEVKREKRKLQEMLEDTKEENERLRDESFAK